MEELDFSSRKHFPGTIGNPFDLILHQLERLQNIPGIAFAAILLLLALLPTWGNWLYSVVLSSFFFLDWLLLGMLPRTGRSFGPAKPPTLVLVLLRIPFALLPLPIAIVFQLVGTLLVVYSFWFEPFRLQVTHQELVSPKLKSESPLRLLHLSDLHLERITQRERHLNQLIQSLKPDLILFSGDILNLSFRQDKTAWAEARLIMDGWDAPLGTYAVSGSPAVDLPEILPKILGNSKLTWLQDEKVTVKWEGESIDLIGLTCTHRPHLDAQLLASLAGDNPNLQILLYHSPDLAPAASRLGIDLQLSGHTHGGQVRLPLLGAVFTGSLYGKAFEAGRYTLEQMVLYISRGIGLEGAAAPRLRLLTTPEIILWEIKGVHIDRNLSHLT